MRGFQAPSLPPASRLCYNRDMSSNSRDILSYNPTVQQLIELHEAALAISSELDLSRLLQRIVEVARQLTRSCYAALGIVGEDGLIDQFLTSGISATEREAIGNLPRGHGLLGVLIKEGRPIRIANIGADPRSVGFPPHHRAAHRDLAGREIDGEVTVGKARGHMGRRDARRAP